MKSLRREFLRSLSVIDQSPSSFGLCMKIWIRMFQFFHVVDDSVHHTDHCLKIPRILSAFALYEFLFHPEVPFFLDFLLKLLYGQLDPLNSKLPIYAFEVYDVGSQ
jgi:hypothetical protein